MFLILSTTEDVSTCLIENLRLIEFFLKLDEKQPSASINPESHPSFKLTSELDKNVSLSKYSLVKTLLLWPFTNILKRSFVFSNFKLFLNILINFSVPSFDVTQ